jgi:hypothetical protein
MTSRIVVNRSGECMQVPRSREVDSLHLQLKIVRSRNDGYGTPCPVTVSMNLFNSHTFA